MVIPRGFDLRLHVYWEDFLDRSTRDQLDVANMEVRDLKRSNKDLEQQLVWKVRNHSSQEHDSRNKSQYSFMQVLLKGLFLLIFTSQFFVHTATKKTIELFCNSEAVSLLVMQLDLILVHQSIDYFHYYNVIIKNAGVVWCK